MKNQAISISKTISAVMSLYPWPHLHPHLSDSDIMMIRQSLVKSASIRIMEPWLSALYTMNRDGGDLEIQQFKIFWEEVEKNFPNEIVRSIVARPDYVDKRSDSRLLVIQVTSVESKDPVSICFKYSLYPKFD